MKDKIILKGVFQELPQPTYHGRIYGMYTWDEKRSRWKLNKKSKFNLIKNMVNKNIKFFFSYLFNI